MTDLYKNPDKPAEYRPRSTAADSTEQHPATVDAKTRASIAARSWLTSAAEPVVTPSTIPGAYRGGR